MKLNLKAASLFLAAASLASAQLTTTTVGMEGGISESLSVSLTSEAASALYSFLLGKNAQIALIATTGAAVGSSDATITLSDTTGIVAGMGILIDGEASLVTSVTSSTVVAVGRATLGTTATTHLISAPVTILAFGGAIPYYKSIIATALVPIMLNSPGPTISGAQSTIAAALAAGVY